MNHLVFIVMFGGAVGAVGISQIEINPFMAGTLFGIGLTIAIGGMISHSLKSTKEASKTL